MIELEIEFYDCGCVVYRENRNNTRPVVAFLNCTTGGLSILKGYEKYFPLYQSKIIVSELVDTEIINRN